MPDTLDAVVIGAGVVGVSTARALKEIRPLWRVGVLEKEPSVALHTSGRNSGVVHAGFNQAPGTLKAKLCVLGNRLMGETAERLKIPFKRVGTVVVAQNSRERSALEDLLKKGQANGVPNLTIVDRQRLNQLEPNALGLGALWAPSGGIVEAKVLTQRLSEDAREKGVQMRFFSKVVDIKESRETLEIVIRENARILKIRTARLINCAGLYADQVAHIMGVGRQYFIVPFRGEYWHLAADKAGLISSMVYPVPDPNYPFLGIHWTKKVDGHIKLGPNAMMAFGRESYSLGDIHWRETIRTVFNPAFIRMASRREFLNLAAAQIRLTLFKEVFCQEASRLVRGIGVKDLISRSAGNRAQLVDRQGRLMDDMLVLSKGRTLHVLNAVSPGLTCSIPFGEHLARRVLEL